MITVVTWNVKHSTATGRIISTVRELSEKYNADVFCLQEISLLSVAPPRLDVRRSLTRATGWNATFARHPHIYPGWVEGVAVMSCHPIVGMSRVRLSSRRRYVQVVIPDTEFGEVCVGSVHLSTPDRRERELHTVLTRAPRRRGILAGDFNLALTDSIMAPVLEQYTADGLPGVDHVCISPDLEFARREIVRTAASDHDAVVAVVRAREHVSESGAGSGR